MCFRIALNLLKPSPPCVGEDNLYPLPQLVVQFPPLHKNLQ